MKRLDLTSYPFVRNILVNRWPQFLLRVIALGGIILAIVSGWMGTPVGNRSFGIVSVWIGWWALLILVAVPLTGRGWCSICPIPLPGEWWQNRKVLGTQGQRNGYRRWPRRLRNIWVQNVAFVSLALFSTTILTSPRITAVIMAIFLAAAFGTSLVFERRVFCRYLCPVGGFIGLYAQAAPLELRVRNRTICIEHTQKTCYTGNKDGFGCPWGVFPLGLVKNNACGLCLECLRTCSYDNLGMGIRPFGSDLYQPRDRNLDEAFKAFIMLGSAMVYAGVMLGPWGWLRTSAFEVGSPGWWGYALGLTTLVLGVLPGLFFLATLAGRALSKTRTNPRKLFIAQSYALIPLGLGAWMAFTTSFAFANGSYILPVVSDPMGWGWDLFGTASMEWTPYLTGLIPYLQIGALAGGLAWAAHTVRRIASEFTPQRSIDLQTAPVVVYCLITTVVLLWLIVG